MRRIGLALSALALAAFLHARDTVSQVHGREVAPYAFVGDTRSEVVLSDSVIVIGEGAFAGSLLKEIVIPDSVTSIGAYAFADCKNLEKVKVGIGVTSLPDGVFKGCGQLSEVSLPAGVKRIGRNAFSGTGLEVLDLSEMTGLDSIADWAFAGCVHLRQLYLPQSLRVIGEGAFMGCDSISEFNLPGRVDKVENYLFTGDSLLNAVSVLHDNVESIGDYALSGTKYSKEVVLPEYLNYIGTGAMERFIDMGRLDVHTLHCVPQLGDSVWGGVDRSHVVLDTPDELRDFFSSADQWRDFKIAVSGIPEGVAYEGLEATLKNGNLKISSPVLIKRVRVFDIQGLTVHSSHPGTLTADIDLTSQPRNVYLVEIATDDDSYYKFKLSDNI